uniref:Uncharacterized protein n=1 Tax=Ditylenchus dipsaci TaxID=166011 RepID=A0A915DUW5_9BILA
MATLPIVQQQKHLWQDQKLSVIWDTFTIKMSNNLPDDWNFHESLFKNVVVGCSSLTLSYTIECGELEHNFDNVLTCPDVLRCPDVTFVCNTISAGVLEAAVGLLHHQAESGPISSRKLWLIYLDDVRHEDQENFLRQIFEMFNTANSACFYTLRFNTGNNVSPDVFLDATLKEAEDSKINKSSLQILIEVFTTPYIRRALFLGMCSLHAVLGVWPITNRLLKDHFSDEMSQIYSTSLFGVNFASCIIGVFIVHRVKRRFLMISSSMTNILSLLAFVIFDQLATMVWPVFSYVGIAAMFAYNGAGASIFQHYQF